MPSSVLGSDPGACQPSARSAVLLNVAVVVLILLSAGMLFRSFWPQASSLWYSASHDRNGHYRRSQSIAFALRQGNVGGFIKEIDSATVWPALHPLLAGTVMAFGGIDYRLAVLPSLAAWAATCWFAFALAWRLVPRYRTVAGGTALLLTLASPAHRAYAVDVMIESLGAALTLGVVYFYVSARQDGSRWRGRCFGLLFLALFMTKYNYWALLASGFLLATAWEGRSFLLSPLAARRQSARVKDWLLAQLRHPVTYLVLLGLGVAIRVHVAGPLTVRIAGRSITWGTIDFPLHLCYLLVFPRLLLWWWRSGRAAIAPLPVLARQLVYWQLCPLAIWFLWPRRLGSFIWYVALNQAGRVADSSGWAGSFSYYAQRLVIDYHINLASLVAVAAFLGLAFLGWRRRLTGEFAVFLFLIVAALLTNYHSGNRSRFLHSWLAVAWVAAGVGAAVAVDRLREHLPAWPVVRPALVGGVLAGLALFQGPALVKAGHAEEGGPQLHVPNHMNVADEVAPEVLRARRPVLICAEPFQLVLDWRLQELGGPRQRILTPPRSLLNPACRCSLDAWLRQVSCDLVVLIDSPAGPPFPEFPPVDIPGLRAVLPSSGQYVLASERYFPAVTVIAQVWRPASASPREWAGP
jgi:hypothetical protein